MQPTVQFAHALFVAVMS